MALLPLLAGYSLSNSLHTLLDQPQEVILWSGLWIIYAELDHAVDRIRGTEIRVEDQALTRVASQPVFWVRGISLAR